MGTPLITLTTDFGDADPYVAQLKGVLLSEGPADLRVVDLSHALPPQDLRAAALFVEAALPRFPAESVHVVVVDPGVGSGRHILLVRWASQWIVAPDNGLLTRLLQLQPADEVLALRPKASAGDGVAPTFHGRDLFAPAAAALAGGAPAATLGEPLASPVRLPLPFPSMQGDRLVAQVLHVDHFGNLICNVRRAQVEALGAGAVHARVGGERIGPLRSHYAEVAVGEPVLLWDSAGRLEVAVRNGNAAERLGVARDARVVVETVALVDGPPA